ncbi:oxidoreductase C-terminal domain-containing protein [Cryobacterium glaciale]|uniref:oxidoreductase C-terminal domain-containing protein n=1 Tax=Cryobacterium glaciale TaxID=1259145 RepID=UPI00141BB224|nr:oxidoreductase C-terminal domain-containing protein [Cryobacterium glaciale]
MQNATDQARQAARPILGYTEPYTATPWFWSSQDKVKIQIAGLTTAHDSVELLPGTHEDRFSALCFRNDALVALKEASAVDSHQEVGLR